MRMRALPILGACLLLLAAATALANTIDIPIGERTTLTLLEQRDDALRFRATVGEVLATTVSTPGGDFVRLELPGFHSSKRIGEPELPMMNRLFEIPFGAEVQVRVLNLRTREIDLAAAGVTLPVLPAQPSVSKSADPATLPFHFEAARYQEDRYFGAEYVRTEDLGRLRAVRLGRAEVAPVRYNPVTGRLIVAEEIEFELTFPGADHARGDWLKAATRSAFFEPVYGKVAGYRGLHDSYPDLASDVVTMVVVAPPMFEATLADYVAWKTERGFKTILAITGTPEVGTTTASIQAYLHGLYEDATPENPAPSFVAFVGDIAQVPTFTVSGDATDRPYCAVDGDLVPDMYYGRMSATNTTMLQNILDKTLMYDQFTMPDPAYLGEVVMIAGYDTGYGSTYGNGQINYGTTYYFNGAHGIYSHTYLYPASGSSSSQIIQNVSDGVAYVNYTAHGSTTSWSNPSFTQSNINNLDNYGEYCLAVGNCCLTSSYEISECFGETWLRAAGKGAIGYIGASNSTYWNEDYWWGIGAGPVSSNPTYETHGMGAYDGVFHDHGEDMDQWYVVNDALVFCGNVAVMEGGGNSTYYWNIYNLSGDPSLSTFLGVPAANPVSHAGQIVGGSTSFTVSAVPGSYVGITVDGALKGAGTVGASGTADIALTDIGYSGTAHLVVMAQNREPYAADLTIGSSEQPTCEIDPLSFDVTLVVGGSTTVPLTIGNEGEPGSTLYYTLAIDDPVLPDRSIAGSTFTSNPTSYTPGATATYTLTVYNASGDYEWLDEVTLDLPAGVTVVSSTNFTGGSGGDLVTNNATGDGARLVWSDPDGSWGEVYGGESATAQVTLTFAGGAMGDLDIPWTMSGDDYGSSPHDINGTLTITGPSGPTLQLVAPNGGEVWAVGDSHDIIFNVTQVDFVRISLSRDGGRNWETLATSAPADAGSWDWTVTGPVSASCLVRLEDTAGQADPVQSAETFYIHVPCDWLSLPWAEGECGAGEYDVIDIGFNAAGLAGGDYHARIIVSHSAPTPDVTIPVWLHVGATDVAETPAALRLEKNYPNPFNPRTTISFSLPAAAEIMLAVYDVRGRQVALLASGAWNAGRHDVVWDGRDGAGHPVASGLYLYRLEADGVRITNKMLLMK